MAAQNDLMPFIHKYVESMHNLKHHFPVDGLEQLEQETHQTMFSWDVVLQHLESILSQKPEHPLSPLTTLFVGYIRDRLQRESLLQVDSGQCMLSTTFSSCPANLDSLTPPGHSGPAENVLPTVASAPSFIALITQMSPSSEDETTQVPEIEHIDLIDEDIVQLLAMLPDSPDLHQDGPPPGAIISVDTPISPYQLPFSEGSLVQEPENDPNMANQDHLFGYFDIIQNFSICLFPL